MWWQRYREERGSQIVEFALVMPLLIYLVLAVPVFGMIVRAKIVAEGAAREGARVLGVTHNVTSARNAVKTEIVDVVGLPRIDQRNGATLFDEGQDVWLDDGSEWATVTVTYRQPSLLPILSRLLGASTSEGPYFTIRASARFRSERSPYSWG